MNVRIFWVHARNACVHRLDLIYTLNPKSFGGMESEPMLTPRKKSPLPGAQRRVKPVMLHHAGQRAQHTTDWAIRAPPGLQAGVPVAVLQSSWCCRLSARTVFVCWLLNVPATCECISGTDLLRQFYLLPHWDRSCTSNFPSHPVTVYWHRADQSQRWPYNARCLAG